MEQARAPDVLLTLASSVLTASRQGRPGIDLVKTFREFDASFKFNAGRLNRGAWRSDVGPRPDGHLLATAAAAR